MFDNERRNPTKLSMAPYSKPKVKEMGKIVTLTLGDS